MIKTILSKSLTLSIVILAAALTSSCGLMPPPKPNPINGHYNSSVTLRSDQITVSKPINFSQYKMLVIRAPIESSGATSREALYLISCIKNLHMINDVRMYDSLVSDVDNDALRTQLNSTISGLNKLTKVYGKILILDIKMYGHAASVDMYFKVFDPADNKVYFSAHNLWSGVFPTWASIYPPMLNALSDWARKNKL